MKVLVCGAGKMVEAILTGLKGEMDLSQFYLYSPSGKSAEALAKKVGAHHIQRPQDISGPEFVWVGCKPQQLNDLAALIKGLFPQATFVSMLAALPEAEQARILGVTKLVRIMPNLPVAEKAGVTLISSTSTPSVLHHLETLFSLIGLSQIVSEAELEELTLLTGSGPAFFYEFAHYLAQSFTSLNESQREALARMVLQGAGVAVTKSTEPLAQMISSVTSKGGVTIAVLEHWRHLQLQEKVQAGVEAGKQRSIAIKQALSSTP